MTKPVIHVVGVGLSGARSLAPSVLALVRSADLIVGAERHLSMVADMVVAGFFESESGSPESRSLESRSSESRSPETWPLGDFTHVFEKLRSHLQAHPRTNVVVLATGDPLFFGMGRLLLAAFPAEQLLFHPQLSSIQLAFSHLKTSWQDATLVSVHGRGEALLVKALKRGDPKIAVLTDNLLTPQAIAQLVSSLDLPIRYRQWVCENLGGEDEKVSRYESSHLSGHNFAALNVVVLLRWTGEEAALPLPQALPLIGLPDAVFQGYPDRPTLMTKREIRLLILGAIAPLDHHVIWDIGAGTGSVSVELSRLCPHAQIYAIEKSAMGAGLIARNAKRLAIAPIEIVQGRAPDAFANLPTPNRIFIGGSSGQLIDILETLHQRLPTASMTAEHLKSDKLKSDDSIEQVSATADFTAPRIVLALATLDNLAQVNAWLKQPHIQKAWQYCFTQANIARSLPVGSLTRLSPLNPVTIATLVQKT
ncbi:MAG: precorrin-6y C5,15-methyltransferase (decarboxylating) subunit CbiE [Cyanobacteria bacterium J06650_10]